MNTLVEIGLHIIETLASLYVLLISLRFLLQLVRADFYNPFSQGISKATNPLLIPLRRFIPGFYGIDASALVLALVVLWLTLQIMLLITGFGLANPAYLLLWAVVGLLCEFVSIYFWGVLIYIIASWIAPYSQNPALTLLRQIIAPAIAPFRKIIPPIGPIDISVMVFIFGLNIVSGYVIPALANTAAQVLPTPLANVLAQSLHWPFIYIPGF